MVLLLLLLFFDNDCAVEKAALATNRITAPRPLRLDLRASLLSCCPCGRFAIVPAMPVPHHKYVECFPVLQQSESIPEHPNPNSGEETVGY